MNWQFWKKNSTEGDKKPKPKSKLREWWDAILFAVIAATLIRWLIMEAYTIPTPSMENSLLVGDFLFVSKFHYGTRTTSTPLQIPLTHQKIWFTDIPSYSNAIRLPQYRLPGISHVKREDVVVFNVPPKVLNDGIDYPPDLKTNYIKRCVAIPGDTLVIKNAQVIVNGTALNNPPEMQFSYLVTANSTINPRNFEKLGLTKDEDYHFAGTHRDGKVDYAIQLTDEKAKEIKSLPYIINVQKQDRDENDITLPYSPYYAMNSISDSLKDLHWSGDNFGPLWIPSEGATIQINDKTLALYGPTIKLYDHNDPEKVKIDGGKLVIDGKELAEYTFKQNYYFMMGDNRHNSLDSRYWGFVPEDHIVGKAFFIWLSIDKDGSFFSKIRWNRFFNLIE